MNNFFVEQLKLETQLNCNGGSKNSLKKIKIWQGYCNSDLQLSKDLAVMKFKRMPKKLSPKIQTDC